MDESAFAGRIWDVIVIGSGPAGCAAAIKCRRSALSCLIFTIEQEDKVKAPVSFESMHPGIETLLDHLHAKEALVNATIGTYLGIQTNGHLSFLGEDENGKWNGYHINRRTFDKQLLQEAVKQGAYVRYNARVVSLQITKEQKHIQLIDGHNFQCKYIIDASGYKRLTGKLLTVAEEFLSPPLICVTGSVWGIPETDSLHNCSFARFNSEEKGWTWLAPFPVGQCIFTRLTAKGLQELSIPPELSKFIQATPVKVANMRWRIFRPVCQPGVIMCSDAAAMLDPASGQGVLQAIYSGIQAAHAVSSILRDVYTEQHCLDYYDNWFYDFFMNKKRLLQTYYQENNIQLI